MRYNLKFAGHFVLFAVALTALYAGSVAIKIRTFEIPVGPGYRIDGASAVAIGWGLVLVGASAAVLLVSVLLA